MYKLKCQSADLRTGKRFEDEELAFGASPSNWLLRLFCLAGPSSWSVKMVCLAAPSNWAIKTVLIDGKCMHF